MPTSVAATVTRAASPAARPVSLIGTVSTPPDFTFSGMSRLTPIVRGAWSMASQRSPSARLGIRLAPSSGAVERDSHVGARAPSLADPDRHLAAAGRQVHLLRGEQAAIQHRDEGPSRHARADLDACGIAGPVGGLVEGDFEHFGAVGALVGPEAGIEHRAGNETAAIADLQAIAAPVHARLDSWRVRRAWRPTAPEATRRVRVVGSNAHAPSRVYHCQCRSRRRSSHFRPLAATALPSAPRTIASKPAASPPPSWPLNSGLMPMRGRFMSMGSVTVRSMVRPARLPEPDDHVGASSGPWSSPRGAAGPPQRRPCRRRRWREACRASCAPC